MLLTPPSNSFRNLNQTKPNQPRITRRTPSSKLDLVPRHVPGETFWSGLTGSAVSHRRPSNGFVESLNTVLNLRETFTSDWWLLYCSIIFTCNCDTRAALMDRGPFVAIYHSLANDFFSPLRFLPAFVVKFRPGDKKRKEQRDSPFTSDPRNVVAFETN